MFIPERDLDILEVINYEFGETAVVVYNEEERRIITVDKFHWDSSCDFPYHDFSQWLKDCPTLDEVGTREVARLAKRDIWYQRPSGTWALVRG